MVNNPSKVTQNKLKFELSESPLEVICENQRHLSKLGDIFYPLSSVSSPLHSLQPNLMSKICIDTDDSKQLSAFFYT
jgi:hypothetical protein